MEKGPTSSRIVQQWGELHAAMILSGRGCEVIHADTWGFDLLVKNKTHQKLPKDKPLAIQIMSRSRKAGRERESYKVNRQKVEKLEDSAKLFGCIPYLGFVRYSERDRSTDIFLLAVKDIEICPQTMSTGTRGGTGWSFKPDQLCSKVIHLK